MTLTRTQKIVAVVCAAIVVMVLAVVVWLAVSDSSPEIAPQISNAECTSLAHAADGSVTSSPGIAWAEKCDA